MDIDGWVKINNNLIGELNRWLINSPFSPIFSPKSVCPQNIPYNYSNYYHPLDNVGGKDHCLPYRLMNESIFTPHTRGALLSPGIKLGGRYFWPSPLLIYNWPTGLHLLPVKASARRGRFFEKIMEEPPLFIFIFGTSPTHTAWRRLFGGGGEKELKIDEEAIYIQATTIVHHHWIHRWILELFRSS